MKVLISAYACEPDVGSEPEVGWAWARAAAQSHDVWLLTRANNAPAIEEKLTKAPCPSLHVVYLDLPVWVRRWKRGQRNVHLYYFLWQVVAARVAQRLHDTNNFDLAHHVTFANDWMPAGVARVRDLPFIWGPVGGATPPLWHLWRWLGVRGMSQEVAREFVSQILRLAFGDHVARRARLVVAQNDDVANRFRHLNNVVVRPNVALDLPSVPTSARAATKARRAVFSGRLLGWKGVRLAVAVLARPEATGWHLDMYGSGPERRSLLRLVRRLGIAERVTLHGNRSRLEVLTALSSADAFLFPSFHDSSSFAVGEAITLGCPVVCLDRGGPPVLVRDGGGTIVPSRGDIVGNLARALRDIAPSSGQSDRWNSSHLPGLVDRWYQASVDPCAKVAGAP